MMSLLLPMMVFVAGTYLFRAAGVLLGGKVTDGSRAQCLLDSAAMLLLVGVMATSTVTGFPSLAALARIVGVTLAVGVVLRGHSIALALIAAASVTAALRALFI